MVVQPSRLTPVFRKSSDLAVAIVSFAVWKAGTREEPTRLDQSRESHLKWLLERLDLYLSLDLKTVRGMSQHRQLTVGGFSDEAFS
jgi:hypothetical protein